MTMVMPRTNISKEITATVKSAYGQKIKPVDTYRDIYSSKTGTMKFSKAFSILE